MAGSKVLVLGAGSWGIALTKLLSEQGNHVVLWEFDKKLAEKLSTEREDKSKLPGVIIPGNVKIVNSLKEEETSVDYIIIVVPSQYVRKVLQSLSAELTERPAGFIVASKGIETNSLCRMSEVLKQELSVAEDDNIVALSGPSHAEEVAKELPTTIVAASANETLAKNVQDLFSCEYFRVYTNKDVAGVELGGAIKNVIAIAAGIGDGLGYGDNAKSALMTRGMVEISRLGMAIGARQETFLGLAGIGDLITTCASQYSRNRHVGEHIGKGKKLDQILNDMTMVAEGVETTRSAKALADQLGVEMPITQKVHEVLFENKNPKIAVSELMLRNYKDEGE